MHLRPGGVEGMAGVVAGVKAGLVVGVKAGLGVKEGLVVTFMLFTSDII